MSLKAKLLLNFLYFGPLFASTLKPYMGSIGFMDPNPSQVVGTCPGHAQLIVIAQNRSSKSFGPEPLPRLRKKLITATLKLS